MFKTESNLPSRIDILTIDVFFLLHVIKEIPFGQFVNKIVKMATNNSANVVHFIFDRYFCPSIKDYERSMRSASTIQRNYFLSGPEQVRTADFVKELRNSKFKVVLINYLIELRTNVEIVPFIEDKKVLLNFDECYTKLKKKE